jgi:hypothetical protein
VREVWNAWGASSRAGPADERWRLHNRSHRSRFGAGCCPDPPVEEQVFGFLGQIKERSVRIVTLPGLGTLQNRDLR